jgi:hypothetical protein
MLLLQPGVGGGGQEQTTEQEHPQYRKIRLVEGIAKSRHLKK